MIVRARPDDGLVEPERPRVVVSAEVPLAKMTGGISGLLEQAGKHRGGRIEPGAGAARHGRRHPAQRLAGELVPPAPNRLPDQSDCVHPVAAARRADAVVALPAPPLPPGLLHGDGHLVAQGVAAHALAHRRARDRAAQHSQLSRRLQFVNAASASCARPPSLAPPAHARASTRRAPPRRVASSSTILPSFVWNLMFLW